MTVWHLCNIPKKYSPKKNQTPSHRLLLPWWQMTPVKKEMFDCSTTHQSWIGHLWDPIQYSRRGTMLPSGTAKITMCTSNPGLTLSPQGKESPGMLQNHLKSTVQIKKVKLKTIAKVQKNTGKAVGVLLPANNCSYSILQRISCRRPSSMQYYDASSLGEEEPKLRVYEKNTRKSGSKFWLFHNYPRAEFRSLRKGRADKGRDTSILKSSLEPENVESHHLGLPTQSISLEEAWGPVTRSWWGSPEPSTKRIKRVWVTE